MEKAVFQFCFSQFIDATSVTSFAKNVFEDSYREFQLQCQAYNEGNTLYQFADMVQHNPKANSLHYKVGFAVGLYIQGLNGIVPGLYDEAGHPLQFIRHEFKIVESEVGNRHTHKVAIRYFTEAWLLLRNFGAYLVLAPANSNEDKPIDTITLQMQQHLSVIRFANVPEKWNTTV